MRRQAAIFILLLGGGALGVIAIGRPDLLSGERGPWLLYLVGLLAFVGSAGFTYMRTSLASSARNALIWLVIIVVLAGGYRLWQTWAS